MAPLPGVIPDGEPGAHRLAPGNVSGRAAAWHALSRELRAGAAVGAYLAQQFQRLSRACPATWIRHQSSEYIDFPAGSMFWAKVDALRPLYALDLELKDFPEEHGQIDGTLHHAVERIFVAVVRHQQYRIGILPQDGTLALSGEGGRNWQAAFETPIATRLTLSSLQARLVSLDIFDTLVVRPFLFPAGARAYLAHLVADRFGVGNFLELRELAEAKARHQRGADVDLSTIYTTLSGLPGAGDFHRCLAGTGSGAGSQIAATTARRDRSGGAPATTWHPPGCAFGHVSG